MLFVCLLLGYHAKEEAKYLKLWPESWWKTPDISVGLLLPWMEVHSTMLNTSLLCGSMDLPQPRLGTCASASWCSFLCSRLVFSRRLTYFSNTKECNRRRTARVGGEELSVDPRFGERYGISGIVTRPYSSPPSAVLSQEGANPGRLWESLRHCCVSVWGQQHSTIHKILSSLPSPPTLPKPRLLFLQHCPAGSGEFLLLDIAEVCQLRM